MIYPKIDSFPKGYAIIWTSNGTKVFLRTVNEETN